MEDLDIQNTSDIKLDSGDKLYTLNSILDFIRPKLFEYIFLTLFLFIFIVGLVGNFLVCYAVRKKTALRTVTNYFLVNLAVADFLVILLCLPASVVGDALQSWHLGLCMCKIIFYSQCVSVFVSVLTLVSISIERYLAICHPLQHFGNSFKTRLIVIGIWLVSMIIPAYPAYNLIIVHDEHVPESLRPWLSSCAPHDEMMQMRFNIFLMTAFYVVPLVVMSYTYAKIAMCLWSSTSASNAISQNLQYESAIEHLQMRRRTAKMLIVVVVTFGLCFLPMYILNISRYTGVVDKLPMSAQFCLFWTARLLVYFNSAVNPVIYNFMSVKFREQFKTACFGCYQSLRCLCRCFARKRRVTSQYVKSRAKCPEGVLLQGPRCGQHSYPTQELRKTSKTCAPVVTFTA